MSRPAPRPPLFLLAHAGGSALVYRQALRNLAANFELMPLELPGRGRRMNEPLSGSLEEILTDLTGQARECLRPGEAYHIFGHSLGGLSAFLLADRLAAEGFGAPRRLIISSACVPGRHRLKAGLLELSDMDLWRASAEYFGALNQEAVFSEELMLLFAPILRADLKAVAAYQPARSFKPLDAPLTAVCAESDIVSPEDLGQWRDYTAHPLDLKVLPGGHFHPLTHPAAIEELILKFDPPVNFSGPAAEPLNT